jgi:hypothetical protein
MNWKAALALLACYPVIWLAVAGWAVLISENTDWIAGAIASMAMIAATDRFLQDRSLRTVARRFPALPFRAMVRVGRNTGGAQGNLANREI